MSLECQSSESEQTTSSDLGIYGYNVPSASRSRPRVLHWTEAAAKPSTHSFAYAFGKRAVDLVLITALLPVLVPVCLVIAIMVKLTSRGPAFYSHRRICRHGAFFSMWKFRTMCSDSAEVLDRYLEGNSEARREWVSCHKLRYDPRVTPIGGFLRKYSLDELPQAWNVLRGQMSLVGPRPVVAAEVEKYQDDFSFYTRVKPGVTGLWQVSGRSRTTYMERVALDCKYVATWSLWLDLKILARTFRSVVSSDGAF